MCLQKFAQALRRLHAPRHLRHERDAHAPGARIAGHARAAEVAAGQHGEVLAREQLAREALVIPAHVRPQIERACRPRQAHQRGQQRQHARELLLVEAAVGRGVGVVLPRRGAGELRRHRHGAAVVGPVQQQACHDRRIPGHEPGAQARDTRALGKTVEHDAALEALAAGGLAGLQESGGRRVLLEVDIRVTLIRGDEKVVAIREAERLLQQRQRQYGAGGVSGTAQEQHLTAPPHRRGHRGEVGKVIVRVRGIQQKGARAGQQRRALVDLVEGIGHGDERCTRAIHRRLHEREQRLARAVHRQHHGVGIDAPGAESVAPREPAGAGGAQLRQTRGRRIAAQPIHMTAQRLQQERRRGVLRLADRHGDGLKLRRRGDAGLEPGQALEGIGVQGLEARIHVRRAPPAGSRSAAWRSSSACTRRSRSRSAAAGSSGRLSKSVR